MDINSYALGFAMGKKKGGSGGGGKDPVLGELTVTENGVYDEPVIGGELDFFVGKTVQFKERYATDDFPEEYQGEGEVKNFPIVSTADCTANITNINGAFGITVLFLVDGTASYNYTYMDSRLALEMGSMMGLPDTDGGWYEQDVAVGVFTKMDNPPSIVIVDDAMATGFASAPFLFTAPSTPADGWNKVTVNVAGDIVDVAELPTENIEEGKIYRVTGGDGTTYGIPNAHPVKRLVDGAWVELT